MPDERLVAWVGGRAELFESLPAEVRRFDPRVRASASFFDRVRALDHRGWADPLGRVRPSWVFYDCALVPGALFGFALSDPSGELVPVSLVALIPTLGGPELVQSLAALELPDLAEEVLAIRTLRAAILALDVHELLAAIPWRSPFMARFLAIAPLRVHTAWTPAHDEPRTVTFSLATRTSEPRASEGQRQDLDDAALAALQADIEAGASVTIVARDDRPNIIITRGGQ